MTPLSLSRVSVQQHKTEILQDISLELKPGEIVAIIGPNGAGKTSLLNTISAEVPANQGEINLCGQPLEHWQKSAANKRALARHLAVLPQFSLLNFPYLVEEVVALGRIPHSTGARLDNDIVAQAMAALDINHLKGRIYTQLSGGEKQRSQLARVMVQIWRQEDAATRLLLLDEPLTALDLGHQQLLMQNLKHFAQQGVGIVMVLHDINMAANYADRILALAKGRCQALATPEQVLSVELLQTLFDARVKILPNPNNKPTVVLCE
ncbi:MAG: heme ABC transporter ATP-binding protein [Alteromonadaceae bacterium]|nr:MAG: heme ABC transporter ATP-binding protein [Alteromonadaceae bacterium]